MKNDKEYFNTKDNNEHFRGKVWVTKGDRLGKNICVDIGKEELKVIAFVPVITEKVVEDAIIAMGWKIEDWLS